MGKILSDDCVEGEHEDCDDKQCKCFCHDDEDDGW